MLKSQKIYQLHHTLSLRTKAAIIVLVAILFTFSAVIVPNFVQAQSAQDEINTLKQQNRAIQSQVADLRSVAASYQDAIVKLQTQINELQVQIANNEAEQAEVQRQIDEAQAELDRQKNILGQNIRAMYLEGKVTTVEMLATSKNLSDFVDKEAYRGAVQRKIQDTLTKIAELQNQLNLKKKDIEALLATLGSQRSELDASRSQQANLLAMNQQQQAEYNAQTRNNQTKINQLQAQIDAQRQANNIRPDGGYYFIRIPGPIHSFDPGNYSYRNAGFSMSTLPGCGNPDPRTGQRDAVDRWQYCTRQCTSYAAWAVEASGRQAPVGWGNAKNWVNRAPASQIHRTPEVGDIAVSTAGTWGHVMYVEQVSGDRIYVSQYNQSLDGQFSYQWRAWR